MSAEMAADQLFVAIKFMHREGIINDLVYRGIQQEIDRWAERQIVDEGQVYGNDCPNGYCEV